MSEKDHKSDEIQALLDGLLPADDRAGVEDHIMECSICRNELNALRWVKTVASQAAEIRLPEGLSESLRGLLDAEDERERGTQRAAFRFGLGRRGFTMAASVAAFLGLSVAVVVTFLARVDVPSRAGEDFRAVQASEIQLQMRTSDGPRLERFFIERGIRFPTRVFDLSMMNYAVLGGRVHELARGPSALFAYQGSDGSLVVCQMYQGQVERLPERAELRRNDDIQFYIFRQGELTMVFWQEGDVTCVMTSDQDPETVIQLAFAKAIKV